LEYVAPTDGRPYPKDSRSNDLWHWQTSFITRNTSDLSNLLFTQYKSAFISSGVVSFQDELFKVKKAALMRDPDGHAVRLVEIAEAAQPVNTGKK
jgi:hypothetical protein